MSTIVPLAPRGSWKRSFESAAANQLPEAELLRCLSRCYLDSETEMSIKHLVAEQIDWQVFVKAADNQAVLPLVYWHLKRICWQMVPAEQQSWLARIFIHNAGRNSALAAELCSLVELFQSHQIQCLPFKGPIIAECVYKELSFRTAGDLDLLVPQEFLGAAQILLKARGYKPCKWRGRTFDERFFQSAELLDFCHEYAFYNEDKNIYVDLHWKLLSHQYFPLSNQVLQNNLKIWELQAAKVTSLNNELTLLMLCAHASKHAWSSLTWVTDVAEFLDAVPDINWQKLLNLAIQLRAERMLLLGLHLSTFLPGTKLPEPILLKVHSDAVVRNMAVEITGRFRSKPTASQWKELKNWLYVLNLKEKFTEKLCLLTEFCTKPTLDDLLSVKLPTSLFPLYRFIRPVNLLLEHVPRISIRFLNGGYDRHFNRLDEE